MSLHAAARSGDLPELLKLIGQGADVNERDQHNRTPMHLAAWSGQDATLKLLLEHKAAVGACAADDVSALHFACQKGHVEAARALLAAGANVNARTRRAVTALHFAAQGSHLEVVKLLIRKGADLTATNKQGKTALELAEKDEKVREVLVNAKQQKATPVKPSGKETAVDAEEASPPETTASEKVEDEAANGEKGPEGAKTREAQKVEKRLRKSGEAEIADDSEATERQNKKQKVPLALSHLEAEDDDVAEDEG